MHDLCRILLLREYECPSKSLFLKGFKFQMVNLWDITARRFTLSRLQSIVWHVLGLDIMASSLMIWFDTQYFVNLAGSYILIDSAIWRRNKLPILPT